MRKIFVLFAAVALMFAATAPVANAQEEALKSIAELAGETEGLSTLAAAVKAAELDGFLTTNGPFTVFAPTDEAFAAALEALNLTAEELLGNKELLTKILMYHVVPGKFSSKLVVAASAEEPALVATTLWGSTIEVKTEGETVTVDGAGLAAVDVQASNGIIHVVDAVLVPSEEELAGEAYSPDADAKTIVEIAGETEAVSTLVAAVGASEFAVTYLTTISPYTVFAPNNDAFAATLTELNITAEDLLKDTATLDSVLAKHVVPFYYPAAAVVALDGAWIGTALEDNPLFIEVDGEKVTVNGIEVIATDVMGSNGVVHLIGGVLLPTAAEEAK